MRRTTRLGLTAAWTAALLWCATPATAHHTSLQVPLVPVPGTASLVLLSGPAHIEFIPQHGGEIRFVFSGAKDRTTGKSITALGNTLEIDLVINGIPEQKTFPFDIKGSKARGTLPGLGLAPFDLVEVKAVAMLDHAGNQFGTMGLKYPGPSLSSALIQVFDTPSDLHLALTKDADVALTTMKGGTFTMRLDKVSPAPRAGNKAELEIAKNGGAPIVFEFPFAINSHGVAKVVANLNLGLVAGDVIEIRRIDLFDADGDRFATLGIRIMGQTP